MPKPDNDMAGVLTQAVLLTAQTVAAHRAFRLRLLRVCRRDGPAEGCEEHVETSEEAMGDTFNFGNVHGDAGNIDKRHVEAGGDVVEGDVDKRTTTAQRDVAQGGGAADWKGLAWVLAAIGVAAAAILYALWHGATPTP